jgi:SAM-dependent methyltransferase
VRSAEKTYAGDTLPPSLRFDEVEATISHLFREPHPALHGNSYGEALYESLAAAGLLEAGEVWEVGGGTGRVAQAMSKRAAQRGRPLKYRFVDLSPALLQCQRRALPDALCVRALAEQLPFARGALRGCVVANEVLADFRVVENSSPEGEALRQKYGLSAEGHWLNAGALHFLEQLAFALSPGGTAFISEFGGDFAPAPVRLEGPWGAGRHTEYSLHFGQLEQAARALAFEVERILLADFLHMRKEVRVASYADVLRMRRLISSLPVLAHPMEELRRRHPILTKLFHFDFPAVASPRFPDPTARAGLCQLFWALLLRKR